MVFWADLCDVVGPMIFLLFNLFLASAAPARAASPCLPSIDNCGYYACRESWHACGPDGYYLGFGEPYCDIGETRLKARMSPQGQIWVDSVAQCLRQRLEETVDVDASCSKVRELAVESHSSCYVSAGFCGLSWTDRLEVAYYLRDATLAPGFLKESREVVEACTGI